MLKNQGKTVRFFTIAQFSIILLFSSVTAISLLRLFEVQGILVALTEESVPIITRTSSLNNDIQSLAALTKFLSESQNVPERQLVNRKLEEAISKININVTNSITDTSFLTKQLSTVYKEIDELNELVQQKIKQQEDLASNFDQFYEYMYVLLIKFENYKQQDIQNTLLEILLLVVKIDQQTRLHELRKIEEGLIVQIIQAESLAITTEENIKTIIEKLRGLLLGQKGLINQKVVSLQIEGRNRGRDNFVRNLISDVASNLEYQSQLVNQNALEKANYASEEVSKQTAFALWAGGFAVIVALGFIYFLYRQIVLRLLNLANQVNKAAEDQTALVEIKGNDEIAGLAKTFSVFLTRVRDQEKALLNMTLSDPLTGIPNRRAFDKQIQESIAQAYRHNWNLTILLVDIDYFKPYNDHYGHADGDACLRLVANQLNSVVLRNTDFCARFGGEEFICLLPNTDSQGAMQKANELRLSIESMKIQHEKSVISEYVTVSIGAATFPFTKDNNWQTEVILEKADKALYRAKADGRNRCSFFSIT